MISINDLTKENIYEIISNANKIKKTKIYPNLSKNNIKVIGIFLLNHLQELCIVLKVQFIGLMQKLLNIIKILPVKRKVKQ